MKRLGLVMVAFGCLLLSSSSAQSQLIGPLHFNQQTLGDYLVTTQASLEWNLAALPGETLEEHALRTAERYLIDNGYLTPSTRGAEKGGSPILVGAQLSISESTITISWSVPGLDVVIVLSNGPIFPEQPQHDMQWIQLTAFRNIHQF